MYTLEEYMYNKCWYGKKKIVLNSETSQKDLKFIMKNSPNFKGITYKEKKKEVE